MKYPIKLALPTIPACVAFIPNSICILGKIIPKANRARPKQAKTIRTPAIRGFVCERRLNNYTHIQI